MRSCKCSINLDPYMGSGVVINRFIKKYGKESFIKEILYIGKDRKDISNKEMELVNENILLDPLCLNLRTGGEYNESYTFHPDVCKQISDSF